ncbi:MAG: hypothetical protein AAFU67_17190 [Bacteroidota bacterium]
MAVPTEYLTQIRKLVAEDRLEQALHRLQHLLKESSHMDTLLIQSARYSALRTHIQRGTLETEKVAVERNRLIASVLDLLNELESRIDNEPDLQEDLERAAKNYRDIHIGGNVTAGGNVAIGNITTINQPESVVSRRLQFLLFVLVPVLALGGAYLAYQYFTSRQPITLKVRLDNRTLNANLPDPEGMLSFTYCDKTEVKSNAGLAELTFEGITPACADGPLRFRYQAPGFLLTDTMLHW